MNTSAELRNMLRQIDHKGYPAYKQLRGTYRFPEYVLDIEHVQGDPFAAPSKVSIHVDGGVISGRTLPSAMPKDGIGRYAAARDGKTAARRIVSGKGVRKIGPDVCEQSGTGSVRTERLSAERGHGKFDPAYGNRISGEWQDDQRQGT